MDSLGLETENSRLKRALAKMKMERDLLKRTVFLSLLQATHAADFAFKCRDQRQQTSELGRQ